LKIPGFGGDSSGEDSPLPPPEFVGRETDISPGGEATGTKRRGRPPGSASKQSLDKLEEKFRDWLLEELVVPITFVSPLAAANIEARAERTAKAAMRIAAKNPKVRRGIEKAIDGSDYFTLAMFPLTTAVCVMVEMGMMEPSAPPARAAGVPRLWQEIYPEEPQENQRQNGSRGARGLYAEVQL
jgi:hypothetical protein